MTEGQSLSLVILKHSMTGKDVSTPEASAIGDRKIYSGQFFFETVNVTDFYGVTTAEIGHLTIDLDEYMRSSYHVVTCSTTGYLNWNRWHYEKRPSEILLQTLKLHDENGAPILDVALNVSIPRVCTLVPIRFGEIIGAESVFKFEGKSLLKVATHGRKPDLVGKGPNPDDACEF